MTVYRIARVVLPLPLRRFFDYRIQPEQAHLLQPGMRVRVPFQSKKKVGIVLELAQSSSIRIDKLKFIIDILDATPIFPDDIFQLCLWAANYYHHPVGEVLWAALPGVLRKGKSIVPSDIKLECLSRTQAAIPLLNKDQKQAVSKVAAALTDFQVFLLDGVTGSGKTEVYFQIIDQVLSLGRQVLVLVPEISLTPQTLERFHQRFNEPVALWHSNLSEQERYAAWCAMRNSSARILIGTRSSVFIPFQQLGLIVIDEEHDASFKQQDRFRYHGRDLAIKRAQSQRIPVILGSATPSLESFYNAQQHRYTRLHLPERAGKAQLPRFHIIDVRRQTLDQGLSPAMIEAVRRHLSSGNQVILFLNRRGYAPVWMCQECMWIVGCDRCDTRLVYHEGVSHLRCHHCDAKHALPSHCSHCHSTSFKPIGLGTQRIEKTLKKYFPEISILRMDKDSTRRKGTMQSLLDEMTSEVPNILIGTQMLAKGHHFPGVTLVGIIDIDHGLLSADFRALERAGQLLLQVSGRAGRVEQPGEVCIQTSYPDHPLLCQLIESGYTAFAEQLLAERKDAHLPPFSHFALFRAEAHDGVHAEHFLEEVKNLFSQMKGIQCSGPLPALIAKRAGYQRRHLLVHSTDRRKVQHFLSSLLPKIETLMTHQRVRWTIDVDPMEIF